MRQNDRHRLDSTLDEMLRATGGLTLKNAYMLDRLSGFVPLEGKEAEDAAKVSGIVIRLEALRGRVAVCGECGPILMIDDRPPTEPFENFKWTLGRGYIVVRASLTREATRFFQVHPANPLTEEEIRVLFMVSLSPSVPRVVAEMIRFGHRPDLLGTVMFLETMVRKYVPLQDRTPERVEAFLEEIRKTMQESRERRKAEGKKLHS